MIKTSELVDRIFKFCEKLTGRTLFPYQAQASKRLIRSLLEDDGAEITLLMARQMGKCFAKNTKIIMGDGTLKNVQDVKIGDKVKVPFSNEAEVKETHRGYDYLYKIIDCDNDYSFYKVNSEHILSLMDSNYKIHNISVRDYLDLPETEREKYFGWRSYADFSETTTKIEPYEYGLSVSKNIKKEYIINSLDMRLALLAGLIDSNTGYYFDGEYIELSYKNKKLAEDILFLIRSLGFLSGNIYNLNDLYIIRFRGNFYSIPSKKYVYSKEYSNIRNITLYKIKIVKTKKDEYFGFELNNKSKLFYLSDFTVVHNSEVVAATVCGCSIIIPILANMPMFSIDRRFKKYIGRDFMCSIYAPAQNQSQIIFNRIKGFVTSPIAEAIFNDPEINVGFGTFNGEQIVLYLKNLGVSSKIDCRTASDNANVEGNSCMLMICDEAQDIGTFKYNKSLSPMCSHYNGTRVLIGTPTIQKGFFFDRIEFNKKQAEKTGVKDHFEYDYKVGCKYNPYYEKYVMKEMAKYGSDSDEFRMAYKLEWVFERGMFITDAFLEPPYALENLERFKYLYDKQVVVGVDVGKKQDSTVVTIGLPDYSKPIIIEESNKVDVPDFIRYKTTIIDWFELLGDNYNEQYYKILEYLSKWNVKVLVIDATGVGTALYDWLNAAVNFPIIPYTFTTKSKSDLAKNLDGYIKNNCLNYVAGEETRESFEFKNFQRQFSEAEKGYRGQDMVVAHPEVRNAHDDYVYSAALMLWGVNKQEMIPDSCENTIYNMHSNSNSDFLRAKRFLAKRR